MKFNKSIFVLFFALALCFIPVKNVFSGEPSLAHVFTFPETDNILPNSEFGLTLFYVFDLRERETFIQFTYGDDVGSGLSLNAHVQIFDVSNNCNENNFFDIYTINDTHGYNMRDIQTNDGKPSGVVLPDGAYGIVVISYVLIDGDVDPLGAFGNLRIIDNNGYEYRTNGQQIFDFTFAGSISGLPPIYTFNFNTKSGITLSDIMGVTVNIEFVESFFDWDASDPLTAFNPFDIDIVDNNEIIFSCRDVTFACVNQDHPLLEELLAESGTSVASFEYGINNSIPHSKGGELLCPGNTISEGFVTLNPELQLVEEEDDFPFFLGFVGLNNGNGRGSFDSFWIFNSFFGF